MIPGGAPDILARSGAVDLLNRSLLSDMLPAQMVRSAGLGVLGSFAPLRAFFMREGLRPGSGFRRSLGASGNGPPVTRPTSDILAPSRNLFAGRTVA